MPSRIAHRGFKELRPEEFGEFRTPMQKRDTHRNIKATRGVTGRDNYQYSAVMTGKAVPQ